MGNNNNKNIPWRLRTAERRFILIVGDILVAVTALISALYFWARIDWLHFSFEFILERPPQWFFLLPFIWLLLLIELYDVRRSSKINETLKGIGIAAVISFIIYLFVYFTSSPNSLPRRGVAVFIVSASLLTVLWRLFYIKVFTAPHFMRRILIVGAGRSGTTLTEIIEDMWPRPFYLAGLIDDDPLKLGDEINGFKVLGGSKDLFQLIEEYVITDIVFAISGKMTPELFRALMKAEESGVEVTTMPIMYEELARRVPIMLLEADWVLRSFVDQTHVNGIFEIGKRLVDIAGSVFGIILLIVVFPFTGLLILIDSGWPIFYSQTRLGKYGRAYEIYKFRTMVQNAEEDGKAQVTTENDIRVTKIGWLLRKSHLDELPQFINVLKGEMSMVGPRAERPEIINKLQKEVPFYRTRLLVKPGITGWAQVNQKYAASVEETTLKLEYDLFYMKHRSLFLDLLILIRTIGTVIGLRGQ
ncbi:MAG: sugar transferase [Anaerolineaceae bacterium]|nr:sugar transferase [Anaerolineaceae bacterium]